MKKILLCILFLSFINLGFINAQVPNVNSVIGNMSNGQNITLAGNGFGVKENAAPFQSSYMHPNENMNFQETGVIDENYWTVQGSVNVNLTDEFVRVNNRDYVRLEYDSDGNWGEGGYAAGIRTYNLPMTGKDYFAWWDYIDPEINWTNMITGTAGVATKYIYLNAGGHPHDVISVIQDGTISGGMEVGGDTSEEQNANLILPFGGGFYGRPLSWRVNYKMPISEWYFIEVFYNMSSAPGVYDGWMELRINNQMIWRANNVNTFDAGEDNEAGFEDINLGGNYGWLGDDESYHRYYGDIYYDDSFARVVLGDSQIYDDCNHLELQIPTAWTEDSINITFNQGSFQDGETAYLFVVDENGNVSDGYEVVVESSFENCSEGKINSICDCNGKVKDSGYCCDGIWDANACRVLSYGFEDWTGDAATTPGYLFGEYNSIRWSSHINHTEVLSNCGSWSPYDGNYFLYGNCYESYDSCLNNSGGSRNMFLGEDFYAGNNPGFILNQSITGDVLYLKFNVLLGDGWKTNTQQPVKFTRTRWLYGNMGDSSSNCIEYSGEGNWFSAPGYFEEASAGLFYLDNIGIDLSDGEWHEFATELNISSVKQTSPGPLHIKVWIDNNLIIERDAPVDVDYVLTHQPVKFYIVSFLSNFWGTEVVGNVTYAYDDFEIWDGMPNQTIVEPICGDGNCEGDETCSSCPQDCECFYPGDDNSDGFVTTRELIDYIKSGSFVGIYQRIIEAVRGWFLG